MTRYLLPIALSTILLTASPASPGSEYPQWILAFEDDFKDGEADDWLPLTASLDVDDEGWLHIRAEATDGQALAPGRYPGDVRLEFDGTIVEGNWISDITPILAAHPVFGWRSGYWIGFVTYSNTRCFVQAPLADSPDVPNPPSASPGRIFHIVAEKVGPRVRLYVDGEQLLEFVHPETIGGPGRDRVGMYVHGGEIKIDNIRIYTPPGVQFHKRISSPPLIIVRERERLVPTKIVSPEARTAIQAANRGNLEGAFEQTAALPDADEKASLLLHLLEDMSFQQNEEAAGHLISVLESDTNLTWSEAERAVLLNIMEKFATMAKSPRFNPYLGIVLHEDLTPTHPLYDKATFYLARTAYWQGRESGGRRYYEYADELFRNVLRRHPYHEVSRIYLGEQVLWGPELTSKDDAPRWASLLREQYVRSLKIIEWWGKHRQDAQGALGGGWGDDVEILRSWNPVVGISTGSPLARETVRRLVDGVWKHGGVDREHGYAADVSDVEHSSEPTGDSQPPMILLAYGDPTYIDRNLRAARSMRDVWTAIAPDGHRRFRSNQFSATEIIDEEPYGVDVPYAYRAVRHAAWLLAYASYPEVRQLLVEWAESWLVACLNEEGEKPRGVAPAALAFEDGRPGGYGPTWWEPSLGWTYYQWHDRNNGRILRLLTTAFALTGEERFLEPLHLCIALSKQDASGIVRPGSSAWVIRMLQGSRGRFVRELLAHRRLTGDTTSDAFLIRHGSPATVYRLTGDDTRVKQASEGALNALRYNFVMNTSEVGATDRAGIIGAEALCEAYTGVEDEWGHLTSPDPAVTWDAPGPNFAALVGPNDTQSLRVSLYSFEQDTTTYGAYFHRLEPGEYQLMLSADENDDHRGDQVLSAPTLTYHGRGHRVEFALLPRQATVITMRQITSGGPLPVEGPDLSWSREDSTLLLYNIGTEAAHDVAVQFSDSLGQVIQETSLGSLRGVENLRPGKVRIRVPEEAISATAFLREGKPELNRFNNEADLTPRSPSLRGKGE